MYNPKHCEQTNKFLLKNKQGKIKNDWWIKINMAYIIKVYYIKDLNLFLIPIIYGKSFSPKWDLNPDISFR